MIDKLKTHIRWMLSGRMGTISSGRVMSMLFTLFSLAVLSVILHKQVTATTPEMASVQAASLPFWGSILTSLVALPYGVTKGAATVSEIISNFRRKD